MSPLLCFFQIVARSSRHHFFLEFDIVIKYIIQIQQLRLTIHQSDHDNAESILELCVLK